MEALSGRVTVIPVELAIAGPVARRGVAPYWSRSDELVTRHSVDLLYRGVQGSVTRVVSKIARKTRLLRRRGSAIGSLTSFVYPLTGIARLVDGLVPTVGALVAAPAAVEVIFYPHKGFGSVH